MYCSAFSVQPDDLRPVEDVKLAEVVRSAVDFRDMTDVRTFVVQRTRQTDVEICSQDRADKPPKHELGEVPIAGANLAIRRNEVEENLLPIRLRGQNVLYGEREILGQPAGSRMNQV